MGTKQSQPKQAEPKDKVSVSSLPLNTHIITTLLIIVSMHSSFVDGKCLPNLDHV